MADYKGIVPYLFYDDCEAAMAWYTRAFGFEEIGRWKDAEGKIHNAEMRVGDTELWLDGSGRRIGNDSQGAWFGIWVEDVDAVYRRVLAAGIECEAPVDRDFGVRMINVPDGMGHRWGFMRRIEKKPKK